MGVAAVSRGFVGAAKRGFGVLGVAVAFAAMGASAIAQPSASPGANPGAVLPVGPPPVAADPAVIEKGRDIFSNYGCGNCHTLSDAGATGHVGPAFDGNSGLSHDFIVDRVTNGQGMMPSFSSQLSADDINAVASYIMKVKTN